MFCFIDIVRGERGFGPNLPHGTGFLLLAEPGQRKGEDHATWSMYRTRITFDKRAEFPQCEPVSDELERLMQSGETYPPALALARNDMRRLTDPDIGRADFARVYAERLRFHLAAQRNGPHFLAEVRETELGYKSAGEFVWIVGYEPKRGVKWVSSDFFVYCDPPSHFHITPVTLAARFLLPDPWATVSASTVKKEENAPAPQQGRLERQGGDAPTDSPDAKPSATGSDPPLIGG